MRKNRDTSVALSFLILETFRNTKRTPSLNFSSKQKTFGETALPKLSHLTDEQLRF